MISCCINNQTITMTTGGQIKIEQKMQEDKSTIIIIKESTGIAPTAYLTDKLTVVTPIVSLFRRILSWVAPQSGYPSTDWAKVRKAFAQQSGLNDIPCTKKETVSQYVTRLLELQRNANLLSPNENEPKSMGSPIPQESTDSNHKPNPSHSNITVVLHLTDNDSRQIPLIPEDSGYKSNVDSDHSSMVSNGTVVLHLTDNDSRQIPLIPEDSGYESTVDSDYSSMVSNSTDDDDGNSLNDDESSSLNLLRKTQSLGNIEDLLYKKPLNETEYIEKEMQIEKAENSLQCWKNIYQQNFGNFLEKYLEYIEIEKTIEDIKNRKDQLSTKNELEFEKELEFLNNKKKDLVEDITKLMSSMKTEDNEKIQFLAKIGSEIQDLKYVFFSVKDAVENHALLVEKKKNTLSLEEIKNFLDHFELVFLNKFTTLLEQRANWIRDNGVEILLGNSQTDLENELESIKLWVSITILNQPVFV